MSAGRVRSFFSKSSPLLLNHGWSFNNCKKKRERKKLASYYHHHQTRLHTKANKSKYLKNSEKERGDQIWAMLRTGLYSRGTRVSLLQWGLKHCVDFLLPSTPRVSLIWSRGNRSVFMQHIEERTTQRKYLRTYKGTHTHDIFGFRHHKMNW